MEENEFLEDERDGEPPSGSGEFFLFASRYLALQASTHTSFDILTGDYCRK